MFLRSIELRMNTKTSQLPAVAEASRAATTSVGPLGLAKFSTPTPGPDPGSGPAAVKGDHPAGLAGGAFRLRQEGFAQEFVRGPLKKLVARNRKQETNANGCYHGYHRLRRED